MEETPDLPVMTAYNLNGRPVFIEAVKGAAKCGLCDNLAKWTVFEVWGYKRLATDAQQGHRVWHWCGRCEDSPFPPIPEVR